MVLSRAEESLIESLGQEPTLDRVGRAAGLSEDALNHAVRR
jgi:hypothetical protein